MRNLLKSGFLLLVLPLIVGCGGGPSEPQEPLEDRAKELFTALGTQDYSKAYLLCSPDFRSDISEDEFTKKMSLFGGLGTAEKFKEAEIVETTIHENGESGIVSYKLLDDEKTSDQRWVLADGHWWWEKNRMMFQGS